jgi:putative endonuclease
MSEATSDPRRALGAEGEARAAKHLVRRGYRIVARNVRAGGVEIDLIARRGTVLAFVEVKTRSGAQPSHGAPALAVDARKQARIARGAAAWLHAERVRVRSVRFDVVSCWKDASGWRIEHWPGAFDAP